MAKVKSLFFAGKSVNVPHTEHRDPEEKGTVRFNDEGFAEVSDTLADYLVSYKPRLIEKLASAPKSKAKK